jgi:hypothetical protein
MELRPPELGDDIRYLTREQLTSIINKGVLEVWDRFKGSAELMAKNDVDPFALKPWLPYLTISPSFTRTRFAFATTWSAPRLSVLGRATSPASGFMKAGGRTTSSSSIAVSITTSMPHAGHCSDYRRWIGMVGLQSF